MRRKLFAPWLAGVTALVASLQPANAVVKYHAQSDDRVIGSATELGIHFSARSEVPGRVEVSIHLPEGSVLDAIVDYPARHLAIRTYWKAGNTPAEVAPLDVWAAEALLQQLSPARSEVESTLQRTFNLLAEAPPGIVLDIDRDFDSAREQEATKSITSLCASTGKKIKATYDTETETHTESVLLGPCYNAANQCLGRCGIGCGVLGSGLSQQFTQDCLNHDLCRLRTGANFTAPCDDEFVSASDDFFAAKDCAAFSGTWKDNYKFQWKVAQDGNGIISGTVRGPAKCGSYSVSGFHADAKIQRLRASQLFPPSGCCRSFTYTGTYKNCSQVGGTWENTCSLSGKFNLSRTKGEGVFTEELSKGSEAGPADEADPNRND